MGVPVIIAGGKGTRLWPVSRQALPKPFVALTGDGATPLEATIARLATLAAMDLPLIVCSEAHGFLARDQARKVLGREPRMLLEPEGRNTAPALCAAALLLQARGDDQPMLALPADHAIRDVAAFAEAVARATALAQQDFLVTFAVAPTYPATGYGYLKLGAVIDAGKRQYRLDAFVEKPDAERAGRFLKTGGYAWTSGMFMFKPSVLLKAFAKLQPEILAACRAALGQAGAATTVKLDRVAFARAPAISIDYAIMEKAANVATVVADLGWSDIGDWQAMWELSAHDAAGNAVSGSAKVFGSSGSLLLGDGPLLVGVGLKDMVAVAVKDAVLVAPRARSQEVKDAVDRLMALGRDEAVSGKKVYRPWGSFEQLHIGPGFQVKELTVNPGAKLSLQRHRHRAEHWVVIAGEGIATRGEERIALSVNQSIFLPLGVIHRLENPGRETLRIIEVQIGGYTGEDDIERFDDIYGR
ncbi:MAG: mannose-1-phosphate guanylyltransferase/mannose-6-phosphate isomerase [Rhizobiales bacterium]|nr:mannose-1-phosphate guanylyltransferase/mannose-6-phosphate isomerase [Hyphomicrobiales bacterium]